MAIIPTYERTQFGPRGSDLPGPSSIDTQTAVQAGKNMQAGGQALLNVGQVLSSIADKQMAAQDAIDRTKASTDADLQLNQLFTDTQQSELNGFVFEDKVKKGGLAIVNNIVSQYSGNVAKEIKSHLYQKYGQLQIQASAESHRKIVDNGEAVRVREAENSINNALRSTALGNPEAIPDAIAGNNTMIDNHLKAGIMNPKQAELEKMKYKEQITWSGFEQTLQNDPEGISKNIEEAIQVFDLTPEQAINARDKARHIGAEIARQQAMGLKAANEAFVKSYKEGTPDSKIAQILQLEKEHGADTAHIIKTLRDVGLPISATLMPDVTAETAQRITAVDAMTDEELKQRTEGNTKISALVGKSIDEYYKGFGMTLAPEDDSKSADMAKLFSKYVVKLQGEGVSDPIGRARKDLFGNYITKGTMRIPAAYEGQVGAITKFASNMMWDGVEKIKDTIDIGVAPDFDSWLTSLQLNGSWYVTKDGKGLMLYHNKFPVMDKTGKPITFDFEDAIVNQKYESSAATGLDTNFIGSISSESLSVDLNKE